MKKLLSIILSLSLALSMTACGDSSTSQVANDSDNASVIEVADDTVGDIADDAVTTEKNETEGGFTVDGTRLLDANGNEFIMRGINEAHNWYTAYDSVSIRAIAETGANCVRIVCGSGVEYTRDSVDNLNTLINLCKDYNLICILEAHDGTGDDSIDTLISNAEYWIEVKDALIGNEAYVILNIANEWVGSWDAETWCEGYTTVIPMLRDAGIKNTIMVDAAGWGQYGKSIATYGMEVFNSDVEGNTMFSIHMYGTAGKNESTIRENLTGVTEQGLCVCVGEFGYTHSDGDVDEAFLMQYCQENGIGYIAWSWKGNGGGVEYLDIATTWLGELSEDWGEVVVNGTNGIRETSVICSIFS